MYPSASENALGSSFEPAISSAHASDDHAHGISSSFSQEALAPNSTSESTRSRLLAAISIAMNPVSCTPKSVAEPDPTASMTARTSSVELLERRGGIGRVTVRTPHPAPVEEDQARETPTTSSRKRAIGGTSHDTSTLDAHPGR